MQRSSAFRPSSWLAASGLALALTAAPVSLDLDGATMSLKSAFADRGGSGNGGGAGGGNGNGRGGADHAERGNGKGNGHGWGAGGVGPNTPSFGSIDDFSSEMRNGKGSKDFASARDRYGDALAHGRTRPGRERDAGVGQGRKAADLSAEETRALIERGWARKDAAQLDGFRNHGHRVSTMVALARELGYGARVGAMQGNFGTPFETGIADIQAELEAARAALDENPEDPELQARVDRLEGDLAAAVEAAKPGLGPDDGWATADLDVNDDGVVDTRDLEAAREESDGSGDTADAGTDETTG